MLFRLEYHTVIVRWIAQLYHTGLMGVLGGSSEIEFPSRWNAPVNAWRHFPTGDNPADCASRGLLRKDLTKHSHCWKGQGWLL